MQDMCWNTLFLLKNYRKKLPKNAEKREKNVFQNFPLFQPLMLLKTVKLRKLKLSRYLKNILFSYKKNWCKNIDKQQRY